MDQSSYYEQRMSLLGITPELNQIEIWHDDGFKTNSEGIKTSARVLKPVPIFKPHDKGIEIIVYTLTREIVRIQKDGSRMMRNWSIIRLEVPFVKDDGSVMKYQMPKGHGSYPFIPPHLITKYEKKEKIHTLFLTEGFFKAFKGGMHGIDIIGLASITHMKNKETGALHEDILKLITACDVERVVYLVDGDCIDLSSKAHDPKAKIDLYRRPAAFFASITTFKQLLDDLHVDKYFFYVDTEGIWNTANFMVDIDKRSDRNNYKGLDDIFVSLPDRNEDIVADIYAVSKPGEFFQKHNLTSGLSGVRNNVFFIRSVMDFYLHHVQRYPFLAKEEFLYNGTKYRYNEDKAECEIIIPGDASKYFRVGDSYYKWVKIKNAYKQYETVFKPRQKSTITDDHGKNFLKHIVKYEAFINVPDHTNYQPHYEGCFNVYQPLEFEADEEECTEADCPTIMSYLKHLFGERSIQFKHPVTKEVKNYTNLELGLDYIQILYQRPTEKLPILCLVSKENNTGKSTFANLLRMIFASNCAIVGNQDLAGDFNAHWCTKLIVACDETKIDKHAVIEKVKSLSTARKITLNAKGKDQTEIDCFIKFIFITNNEQNFIYITDDDIRYWVNKVPVLKQENPGILESMEEEIPAFLSFLNRRKLSTEKLGRMWMHPSLLKTDALKNVVANSGSTPKKEIIQKLRDIFFDFGVTEVMMTRQAIHEEFFRGRYEANYLEKILKEELKVDMFHTLHPTQKDLMGDPVKVYKVKRHSYPKWSRGIGSDGKEDTIRIDVNQNGRPYIFKRENFLSPEEIASIEVPEEFKYINENTVTSEEEITAAEEKNPELPF